MSEDYRPQPEREHRPPFVSIAYVDLSGDGELGELGAAAIDGPVFESEIEARTWQLEHLPPPGTRRFLIDGSFAERCLATVEGGGA